MRRALGSLRFGSSSPMLCGSGSPMLSLWGGGTAARCFTAPPNIGPGKESSYTGDATGARFKPKPQWIVLMMVGCVFGGAAAAQLMGFDKDDLPPMFRRAEIEKEILRSLEFRPDLAATALRCAFVLAARRAGVTAVDVDESCAVAAGLDDVAGLLSNAFNYNEISMEDLTALVAIAAVKYLGGPTDDIPFLYGRRDAEKPAPKLPLPAGATRRPVPATLKALGDLTDAECVALMACHAVGEYHEDVTGIEEAQRSLRRYRLGPHYYRTLLAAEKSLKPIDVMRTEGNRSVRILPEKPLLAKLDDRKSKKPQRCVYMQAEVHALLQDPAWRSWVEVFAKDKAAWEKAFQSAFSKMINGNVLGGKLRPMPVPAK